jgi:preprotein translocase subunit Sec63
LEDGVYESLRGVEFTRKEIGALVQTHLSRKEAKNHPVWQVLARSKALLKAYVASMFAEMKREFGYNAAMNVRLASAQKMPTMQAACITSLYNRSQLWSDLHLSLSDARLVGVVPEARRSK